MAFSKKCKNMFTKQEIVSDAAFKAWLFSSDFSFACKKKSSYRSIMQVLLSIGCKPYQVAKSSILNEEVFWDPPLKSSPCAKTSQVSFENQSFFLLFRNVAIFMESHCVFLCYFLQYDVFYAVATTILFLWIQSMVFQSENYL